VLQNADVIFLMGARLNWIMHFGMPPRFNPDVRIVQLDIDPNEIGHNIPTEVALVGDAKAVTGQVNAYLKQNPWQYPSETTWRTSIQRKIDENVTNTAPMLTDDSVPMGYYRVLKEIARNPPRRDGCGRGRQHHGHQPPGDQQQPAAPPPRRRYVGHDGRRSAAGDRCSAGAPGA